jgi:hypothetical protein
VKMTHENKKGESQLILPVLKRLPGGELQFGISLLTW